MHLGCAGVLVRHAHHAKSPAQQWNGEVSEARSVSVFALSRRVAGSRFRQPVTGAGIQIEPVEFLQILYAAETFRAKRTFTVECM
jgi:hypothetical protein